MPMKKMLAAIYPFSFLLAVILLFITQTGVASAESVTATHVIQGEGNVMLQLAVSDPPPASIIISLHLTPPVEILHANPPFTKYDSQKNEAKWLLKDVKAGTHEISYRLSPPFSSDQVDCDIRYRDPRTGAMITQKVPLTGGS